MEDNGVNGNQSCKRNGNGFMTVKTIFSLLPPTPMCLRVLKVSPSMGTTGKCPFSRNLLFTQQHRTVGTDVGTERFSFRVTH